MKIKSIAIKNKANPWELERIDFSNLTLLVGASGVGKTQILNHIIKLVNISNGYVYNGIEWDFHFTGDDNENYRWTGEFESEKNIKKHVFQEKEINGQPLSHVPKLLNEKLFLENELVFERNESNVKYEKKDTPKVSPHKSVLNLFTNEEKILPIKKAFKKILFFDYDYEQTIRILKDMKKELQKIILNLTNNSSISKIETSDRLKNVSENSFSAFKGKDLSEQEKKIPFYLLENTYFFTFKLFFSYNYFNDIFTEIVAGFRDIFPQVEDVAFKLLEEEDVYELQIKERDTGWISTSNISSGMFKTFLHLAGIKLLTNGYVVLIDEFENSLGVNCLDAVANDLLNHTKDQQYIITSHHPYIINNIDMKYWKLVKRKGTVVSTKNADQLKLGKSKHEAFKQLLNLEEFTEGIS